MSKNLEAVSKQLFCTFLPLRAEVQVSLQCLKYVLIFLCHFKKEELMHVAVRTKSTPFTLMPALAIAGLLYLLSYKTLVLLLLGIMAAP